MSRVLSWFSCGAASAVAAKYAIEEHGADVEVVLCDTLEAEHPDNRRFLADVERWLDRKVTVIRSSRYRSVDDVFERARYMSGPAGARCTVEMKKLPREEYQRPGDLHVFGFTADEERRALAFEKNNPSVDVQHVLVERGITKQACYAELERAGIALPAMYALGFDHNNCIGCVKATSPGYWNRVRRLFPEHFARRAEQARAIGARLARVSVAEGEQIPGALPAHRYGRVVNYRVFLDVLPPEADAPDDAEIECGPACQLGFDFLR